MEKYIKGLTNIGLTELEAKVYINMLKKQYFTATEIATISKINRTQTYDILSKLINRGMCSEIRGKVRKYSANDPENVFSHLKKEIEQNRIEINKLETNLKLIYKNKENNQNPLDFIQVLTTRSSIISKVESLETDAKESVLAFNKPPYAMNIGQSNINNISPEIRKPEQVSITRGVLYKSLYEIEPENKQEFIKKVQYFQKMGENVKLSYKLPFKLFIFDTRITMLALRNTAAPGLSFTTMTIEHSDFAKAHAGIFELYWEKSLTIEEFMEENKLKKED